MVPASILGIASPLCMYGAIPLAASFSESGMADDWLAAFMMSSILLNPQFIIYSAALGPAALAIRILSSFLCGAVAGLLVRKFFRGKRFFNFSGFSGPANRDTDPNPLLRLLKNIGRNVKATGPWFLLGIALSALEHQAEGGSVLSENLVETHFADYDSYLVLSHFKGHAMAGFGGAIKNISIGLGSRTYTLVDIGG